MHQGFFPDPADARVPYVRGAFSEVDLDPIAPARSNRRQWLLGAAGLLTGLGLGHEWSWTGAAPSPVPARTGSPAPRGTLEWALAALNLSEDEILASAGDLERVGARHRAECHLVPVFERLLEVALSSRAREAAAAAACAARSLVRLGRDDLLSDALPRIEAREGFAALLAEVHAELAAAGERRRRGRGR
jgi:hypothetical protein